MKIRPSAIVACIAAISFLSACMGPSAGSGVRVSPTQARLSPTQASDTRMPVVGIATETECFTGPATGYDPVGVLAAGKHYQVVAIDDEPTWFQIDPMAIINPDPPGGPVNELSPQPDPPGSVRCWVPRASVDLGGDLTGVPVIQMPLAQMLGSTPCYHAPAEGSDVARSLDGGTFFRIVAIDDEPTWFEIDPTAVIDPLPPGGQLNRLAPQSDAPASERCWVPAASVALRGDLSQVPVIPIAMGLASAKDVSLEIYRSPLEVEARCSAFFEDRPAVRVIRTPRSLDPPSVTVDGEAMGLCYGTAPPGAMECLPLPGEAGSTVTVRTCFPGDVCSEWPVVVPACPEPSITEVVPVCSSHFDHYAAVQIHGAPASFEELRVYLGLERAGLCHTPGAGVLECLPLLGDVGSHVVVTTDLPDEGRRYWTMTVPDCSGEPPITYNITSMCFRSPTPLQAVNITYDPTDSPLVSARADGTDLRCRGVPGRYACDSIVGEPGDEVTLSFCIRPGGCFSEPVTVSDCGASGPTPSPWEIVATGCHDRERIYFILHTSLAWLVPGADFTYSATDGVTRYSCEIHPTTPGGLYCSGALPGGPGQLQVSIRQGSSAPVNNSFVNWPSRVRSIGSCAPTQPPPPPPCSSYKIGNQCPTDRCRWTGNLCVPK